MKESISADIIKKFETIAKQLEGLEKRISLLEKKKAKEDYMCEEWSDPPLHNFFPPEPIQEWCVCGKKRNDAFAFDELTGVRR